jgi:hypothetical protein
MPGLKRRRGRMVGGVLAEDAVHAQRLILLGTMLVMLLVGAVASVGVRAASAAAPVPVGSFHYRALPDGRAWEIVSPLNKNASIITGINGFPGPAGGGVIQAEERGNSIVYASNGSFEKPLGSPEAGQYLSVRGEDGWLTTNINPPMFSETYFILGSGGPYRAFSSDLSHGLLLDGEYLPVKNPPLTSDAPVGYQDYYLHDNHVDSTFGLKAVLTEALIKNAPSVESSSEFGFRFEGATPDLGHVIFSTRAALTPDAIPGSVSNLNLYEWSGGELQLVNILPGEVQGTPGAMLGLNETGNPSGTHPMSDSGSVVFFTDMGDLYARRNAGQAQSALGTGGECTEAEKACTVQVDASHGGLESGHGEFRTASRDGSRVFFADRRKLTGDSTAVNGSGERDLYEYDLTSGRLTDLTTGDPAGANVQGVMGASEDGSYVYFVASGALAQGASRGPFNLYVWHRNASAGTTRFIAALSGDDNEERPKGQPENADVADDWHPEVVDRTARVTPDGLDLVFMSDGSLTGYDSTNAETGQREQEVYVYNASSEVLSCASCRPTGARPIGPSSIPGGTAYKDGRAVYQSRVISDVRQAGGVRGPRVFFDSSDAIVPQDTNGARDVYEWEEDRVGSCGQLGGCVSLISSGTSSSESSFADASADGSDVFFLTYAGLVPQDTDGLVDVYDAREGGGFPGPPASLACTGTGCQGVPAAPPVFATPSSVTFNGVGNFTPPASKAAARKKPKPRKKAKAKARGKHRVKRRAVARRAGEPMRSMGGRA